MQEQYSTPGNQGPHTHELLVYLFSFPFFPLDKYDQGHGQIKIYTPPLKVIEKLSTVNSLNHRSQACWPQDSIMFLLFLRNTKKLFMQIIVINNCYFKNLNQYFCKSFI